MKKIEKNSDFFFFFRLKIYGEHLGSYSRCGKSNKANSETLFYSTQLFLIIKFIYSEKATKLAKSPLLALHRTNLQWRFRKNLWPFENYEHQENKENTETTNFALEISGHLEQSNSGIY